MTDTSARLAELLTARESIAMYRGIVRTLYEEARRGPVGESTLGAIRRMAAELAARGLEAGAAGRERNR